MFQQHLVVFILRFEPMCNPSEEVFLFKTHVKIQCLVRMSHWSVSVSDEAIVTVSEDRHTAWVLGWCERVPLTKL